MKSPRIVFVARPRPGGLFRDLLGVGAGLWATAAHMIEKPVPAPAVPPAPGGLHLKLFNDGTPRCVACGLCAAVCPTACLTIVRAPLVPGARPLPSLFEVDELRCISCNRCVEICPEDALDTSAPLAAPSSHRHEAIRRLFPDSGHLPKSRS